MRIQSMKSKPCPYKPITCSEGYCQDCQIYLQRGKKNGGIRRTPNVS